MLFSLSILFLPTEGHSYVVYGPLVNGGTTLLFESTPTYPDPGRYWEMIEKHRVSQVRKKIFGGNSMFLEPHESHDLYMY